ncbi:MULTISPECIES: hypothetical protein [unclassified Flavobacterium]|jgi:hypothetical protein|uniref:Uncharacterized protein n=1 Tax=Flavobacterium aureirubrum TaxID=3133147 RepID=A0ABU9NBG9_9FLAO
MNLENQLLEKFQVEELEKRYEFSWVSSVEATPTTISEPNHEDPFGGPNEIYYGGSVIINLNF